MARAPLPLESNGKIRRMTTAAGTPAAIAYYRDIDGKRRRLLRTGETPAKAQAALEKALKERLTPAVDYLTPASSLSDLAVQWIEDLKRTKKSPSTVRRYQSVVNARLNSLVGAMRISEATVPRLQRIIDLTAQDSEAQARMLGVVLAGMFDLAVRHGASKDNPAKSVRLPIQEAPDVRAPNDSDVRELRKKLKLYDSTPPKRGDSIRNLASIADMMLATGARIGEVLALQWSDFNLEAWTVTIQSTLVSVPGEGLVRRPPKTKSSVRTLTLPQFIRPWISNQMQSAHVAWVFPSANGTPRWPENVRAQWRDALAGSEVSWIGPHSLRKGVATLLGTEAAREQLGHASITVTDAHYIEKSTARPDMSDLLETFGR